ncbi:hypothetical protein PIB30_033214 [Stylosanthes scabra]|uniref:RRM domain-containing protein n=1 Tax=Stylosanthes scabra TaxID=79078 RepID=A0ABU6TCN0_9FABA|nr:hypothetical protein [Stylosanthes scabra]
MRGGRSGERGIHGEESSYAGGRNKGENGVGFASVFVDNLPINVTKRELYKEFGLDGYVTDIYISRKLRLKTKNPFAFIRYQRLGGALRVIRRLNGTVWRGGRLFITISKFRHQDHEKNGAHEGFQKRQLEQRMKKKWVEVSRPNVKGNGRSVDNETTYGKELKRKQEVNVTWSAVSKDLLNRSLLGVCTKPIEFRKTMNLLLDEWKGEGEMECRDMGHIDASSHFHQWRSKKGL